MQSECEFSHIRELAMSDDQTQRLIGALEAQARAFERALSTMHNDMDALRGEVQSLNKKLASIEGGRKALWGLLAAAGIIGGIIAEVLRYLFPGIR